MGGSTVEGIIMNRRIGMGFCGVTLALVVGAGCSGETAEEGEIGVVQQQIIAGNDADKGEYPWIANIQIRLGDGAWVQNCTGSLIAPNWILTAAHCFYSGDEEYALDELRITLGDHSLSDTDGDEQVVAAATPLSIVDLHPHPEYSGWTNDVGLIELSSDVEINEWVQVVPLADGDDGPQPVSAAGWGVLNVNPGDNPDILQEANEAIVSHEACGALSPLPRPIDADDICFGSGQVTQACHGDSGGPLTVERASGCVEQVGVSSFGTPDCHGGYSVYARVSKYLPWITSMVPNLGGGTTYEAEAMQHAAGGTYDDGWNLHSNGYVSFTHPFEAGSNTLIVTAAGEEGQGWPNMRVTVGGEQVFNQLVSSPTWTDYTMTFNRNTAGNAEVRIHFTNDLYLPGIDVDRNLLLDKARVPGETGCSSGGSSGALTTSFIRESVWNTGYCARISMTNPAASSTTSWTATVDAVSGTVSKYWTPETLTNTASVTFPSESWNAVIQPNGTYGTAGFCVDHPPGGYVPPVVTVNATY